MTQTIIPARFKGLKKYTIEYRPAVDIQLFGKSWAKAGELDTEELANLELDYPNFNVHTYYATVPNVKRNFLPIIGNPIRKLIGVSNSKLLIIDLKKFITQTPELKDLVKHGYHDSDKQIYNRILAIKVLLLRNLDLLLYSKVDKDQIAITDTQIHFQDPGPTQQEGLQHLIHEALGYITVDDVLELFKAMNTNKY
jgi:hypothetical protein